MRDMLHKLALRGEGIVDRFRRTQSAARIIESYAGYSTPDHLIVRGRVLTSSRRNAPRPDQSKLTNLRQMISLFLTDEVADVTVLSGNVSAQSDEEGYFTLILPHTDQTGWLDVPVTLATGGDVTLCPVLMTPRDAQYMVISDIDDTVLQTGAYSLLRNLWTSMTGNAATRRVFPDAVTFLDALTAQGRNPIFYVSSSPWNLYTFLQDIFARAGLPMGPMFLRDLGLSETKFITGGHGNHKGASIDAILAASPDLPAILIGDSGQKDAAIYADVIARHPNRIAAVVLRQADDGLDVKDRAAMARIRQSDTRLMTGKTFDGMMSDFTP